MTFTILAVPGDFCLLSNSATWKSLDRTDSAQSNISTSTKARVSKMSKKNVPFSLVWLKFNVPSAISALWYHLRRVSQINEGMMPQTGGLSILVISKYTVNSLAKSVVN